MARHGVARRVVAGQGMASRGKVWQAGDLVSFESEIADLFNSGSIPFPVHLSDGNEDALIEVFQDVQPNDWICGSWRSHYHCLLKGVPPDELKAAIVSGQSIALCFPKYRILNSAIVGGSIPIALGIAMGIKRRGESNRVHCFMGDMTSYTGVFTECSVYASRNDLPVHWIIEDNGISVCTDTASTWGEQFVDRSRITHYNYEPTYPHAGAGQRVQF